MLPHSKITHLLNKDQLAALGEVAANSAELEYMLAFVLMWPNGSIPQGSRQGSHPDARSAQARLHIAAVAARNHLSQWQTALQPDAIRHLAKSVIHRNQLDTLSMNCTRMLGAHSNVNRRGAWTPVGAPRH